MSARQAAEGYDQVVRKIQFGESHPHVQIEMVTAPYWHWTATWVNQADQQVTKTHRELRGLLDELDVVDWDTEQPKPLPPREPAERPRAVPPMFGPPDPSA